jgi:glycosyltransferase involved in cell wall biosynthesis
MARRVLYLTTSLATLGPATALVELALRLDPLRYTPLFGQLSDADGAILERRLTSNGVPLQSFGAGGAGGATLIPRLAAFMRRERVAVVHTRLIRADFLGRLAARLAGVPLVITNLCDLYSRHFSDFHGPRLGPWLRRMDTATLPLTSRVVANSEDVRDDALRLGICMPGAVETIHNGVDTIRFRRDETLRAAIRRELGLPASAWVVGNVARLSPKKRHDVLIDAVPLLKEKAAHVHVLIVGDGECRARLEARARDRGVLASVSFVGARFDIPALMSAMDIFAFPSAFEGCPNAVLEAMSCGLAVVAANAGGTRELVVPGETGELVPFADPRALANGLLMFRDEQRSRTAGEAARRLVEARFTLDTMAERFQELYDRGLARTPYE